MSSLTKTKIQVALKAVKVLTLYALVKTVHAVNEVKNKIKEVTEE